VAPVSARATVTAGARFDAWGLTDAAVASPWAFMDLRVTPRTIVRVGSGLYRQFPTFEQVNGLRGGGDNLLPETARHLDIGLTQTLRSDLTLQATWFDRREQNVLWTPDAEPRRQADGSIQPGRGDAPWFNALDGRARGVELVFRRDAPSALSGWVAYAYATDRNTTLTGDETFWADFDQRHSLSLFGRYPISNRTALGAKFRYGSNYPLLGYIGQQASSPVTPLFGGDRPLFYQLVQSRNTLRLPNYARLDVRADRTFTWSRRRVTLFAEVANALNRRNLRNEPYGVDRSGRVFNPTGSLLPILPSAGFVIEF
jgi:outer membrane receptor for ferrienterochelin and colicin